MCLLIAQRESYCMIAQYYFIFSLLSSSLWLLVLNQHKKTHHSTFSPQVFPFLTSDSIFTQQKQIYFLCILTVGQETWESHQSFPASVNTFKDFRNIFSPAIIWKESFPSGYNISQSLAISSSAKLTDFRTIDGCWKHSRRKSGLRI